ncbi:hypothetical protein CLV47_10737 [Antricoccus suffuscus]|uniref:Uncharacterized protein n=1 Tax=Antricoccus suffuscus TaxID=1629062 RepID=A0A2T0ZZX6_9ACTN|nr:hypothetical protein [Antricoccus suffuscus]PRZ41911.1 hypothetical protein CLV47_10737 [Antricoccus suffuscus]
MIDATADADLNDEEFLLEVAEMEAIDYYRQLRSEAREFWTEVFGYPPPRRGLPA